MRLLSGLDGSRKPRARCRSPALAGSDGSAVQRHCFADLRARHPAHHCPPTGFSQQDTLSAPRSCRRGPTPVARQGCPVGPYLGALTRVDAWRGDDPLTDGVLAAYLGAIFEAGRAPASAAGTTTQPRLPSRSTAPVSRITTPANVIKPQGLEPLQFPTKFRSHSRKSTGRRCVPICRTYYLIYYLYVVLAFERRSTSWYWRLSVENSRY